jgi:hypothetical protein
MTIRAEVTYRVGLYLTLDREFQALPMLSLSRLAHMYMYP